MFIAIDPGLNNCGVALLSQEKDHLKVISSTLVNNIRKSTEEEKELESKFDSRLPKVLAITNTINTIIEDNDIEVLVVEAPFYNSLTPGAFGALLEVIYAIKYTIALPKGIQLRLIEPTMVKRLFTTNRIASKSVMKTFLGGRIKDKSIIYDGDIEALSEHEVDAIAIGFTYLLHLKEKELCSQQS